MYHFQHRVERMVIAVRVVDRECGFFATRLRRQDRLPLMLADHKPRPALVAILRPGLSGKRRGPS